MKLFRHGKTIRNAHPNILPHILKNGLNNTPVKGVKIFGNYESVKDVYTERALDLMKSIATKHFDGLLGLTRPQLDSIHKERVESARKRLIENKPYIQINKPTKTVEKKELPEEFLKPVVITTGQSGKRHFTINALNAMNGHPDFSGAFMSDMEDSTVYNLHLSTDGIRNDRDALNGSIMLERDNKPTIKLNTNGLFIKRVPAIERNSFVYIDYEDINVVIPAPIVEMILYYEHCGQLAKKSQNCIPFYLPKLRHKEDHFTMVEWQTEIANNYNLEKETVNTILIEDPGLLEDLYDVYADKKTAVCNAALWDYQRRITENMTIPSSQLKTLVSNTTRDEIINLTQMSDRQHMATDISITEYKHFISKVAFDSGKITEGGMDTRIPSKNVDELSDQLKAVEYGKKVEAVYFGNIRAWAGHPAITPNVAEPFIRKKNKDYNYFKDIINDSDYLFNNLNSFTPLYDEISNEKLSSLTTSRPLPTLKGFKNACQVSIYYIAAQLSYKQEGCIGLSGLFQDSAFFEDYATTGHSNKMLWQAITYKTKLQPCNHILTMDNITEFVNNMKIKCILEKESRNLNYICENDFERASNIVTIMITRDNYMGTAKCLLDMYHAIESRYERDTAEYNKQVLIADRFIDDLLKNKYNRQELEELSFDPDLADIIG